MLFSTVGKSVNDNNDNGNLFCANIPDAKGASTHHCRIKMVQIPNDRQLSSLQNSRAK